MLRESTLRDSGEIFTESLQRTVILTFKIQFFIQESKSFFHYLASFSSFDYSSLLNSFDYLPLFGSFIIYHHLALFIISIQGKAQFAS